MRTQSRARAVSPHLALTQSMSSAGRLCAKQAKAQSWWHAEQLALAITCRSPGSSIRGQPARLLHASTSTRQNPNAPTQPQRGRGPARHHARRAGGRTPVLACFRALRRCAHQAPIARRGAPVKLAPSDRLVWSRHCVACLAIRKHEITTAPCRMYSTQYTTSV